ncbi:MAG: serine hydroxymethyltransferase [Puniceicoccales bacterium]|jgi:glycine hydroxymethyltransferase|nr:serine hydroxymethyltransferase [Puniceicoccales bacterium]
MLGNYTDYLGKYDPDLADAIGREENRQQSYIELIASENFTSKAVIAAAGSVLTNKYAEGYPGRRYYGGCDHVDEIEVLAIERAKELFGAEHVNVQPHSGSQANTAVYMAMLKPGDSILTLSLENGGHLTHGHPKNISGMLYNVAHYGVSEETCMIEYDAMEELAHKIKPKMITIGASAYSRTIDFRRVGEIAKSCGALLLADIAHIAGLVAAKLHNSPMDHADFVTTTTHKTLRGPRGGMIMCKKEFAKEIDSAVFPCLQGGPLMHIIAGKAVCFKEALSQEFVGYQQQVLSNAKILCNELKRLGFKIVSDDTDNHLMLIDLRKNYPDINGNQAQRALDLVNITTNKNAVHNESRSVFQASGLRLGTPAVTTRGMKEPEMIKIADLINRAMLNLVANNDSSQIKEEAIALCDKFPLFY